MLERKLSNALLSIVLDGENTRPAITEAVRDVRSETVRKLEEFGYIQDGETIRDYIAFPKNNMGRDVMLDAPSKIDNAQMEELFLVSTAKKEEK